MKITCRSGLRDPPNSLTNSLSRRLKNSGSMKGGASPAMFPATGVVKKRGSFENPEPSSPKVTCIGQVRVKGRKKQKSLSRRHSANEISFRKLDQSLSGFSSKKETHKESFNLDSNGAQNYGQTYVKSQNQECCDGFPVQRSWVHFPVTICDALRAFGSEFSCLFPCRKEEKMVVGDNRQGSCGVFARWLVAVQDGDGGGRRDVELVVDDDDEDENEDSVGFRKTRRHVFEDLEIVNDRIEGCKDEGRVSVCVPPKNALLLMRCRSDPVKIQALNSNKSWEGSVGQDLEENVEEIEVVRDQELEFVEKDDMGQDQKVVIVRKDNEFMQKDEVSCDILEKDEVGQDQGVGIEQKGDEFMRKDEVGRVQEVEFMEKDEVGQDQNEETSEENEESLNLLTLFEEFVNQEMLTEIAKISDTREEKLVKESNIVDNEVLEKKSEKVLPECLLMMMNEPKLSMEVSKETWVCSKDFSRKNSSRKKPPTLPAPATVNAGERDQSKAKTNVTTNGASFGYDVMRMAEPPMLQQPARSSCSFPATSMATMLEEKLANAVGYEPFVLTRCKSEPMKTAAAKLLPESCVLENRKLERLSRGTFGVGAAGLGF